MAHLNMTREQAIKVLKPLAKHLIRNVYDDLNLAQSDAIFALVPNFEYPDWDSRRVSSLWSKTR